MDKFSRYSNRGFLGGVMGMALAVYPISVRPRKVQA